MDKDRVKGTMDDAAGRAKRQVGEWTDDSKLQAEGAAQQVKGKVENAWGKTKDAVRDAGDKVTGKHPENENPSEEQGKKDDQRRKDVA
ncbi:MAG: CsbD family protein [Candidatus Korobacteraceae bacterium]